MEITDSIVLTTSFKKVLELIRKTRFETYKSINKHLINLYWSLGEYVSKKVDVDNWGKSTVEEHSKYILINEPELKGFSSRNIWRMKLIYDTYKENQFLTTLLSELSWSANLHILSKTKTIEEKEFYLKLAIKEKLSVRELERQIDTQDAMKERFCQCLSSLTIVFQNR
jgi:predicted nuclease of restriction endonuclease-like (RecB) superfamily